MGNTLVLQNFPNLLKHPQNKAIHRLEKSGCFKERACRKSKTGAVLRLALRFIGCLKHPPNKALHRVEKSGCFKERVCRRSKTGAVSRLALRFIGCLKHPPNKAIHRLEKSGQARKKGFAGYLKKLRRIFCILKRRRRKFPAFPPRWRGASAPFPAEFYH